MTGLISWRAAGVVLACLMLPSVCRSEVESQKTGAAVKEKLVMGWLESIYLQPWNIQLTAKLDTGAKTSSLHADHIVRFTRDGTPWVRFRLSRNGKPPIEVERPLVRTARVKERKSMTSERDVVRVVICKAGRHYDTEFTLVDRSHFNYPVLLGRSFLKDVALVDSGATFIFGAEQDRCRSENDRFTDPRPMKNQSRR